MPKTSAEIEKSIPPFVDTLVKPVNDAKNDQADHERRVKACVNNINHRIMLFANKHGYHLFSKEGNVLSEALAIVNEEFEMLDGVDLSLGEKRE